LSQEEEIQSIMEENTKLKDDLQKIKEEKTQIQNYCQQLQIQKIFNFYPNNRAY
jgi:prefoldin subunit 5